MSTPHMPDPATTTASPAPMLRMEGVSVRYGGVTAVREVSLVIPKNRIVAFIGPSGSGKSTLIRALNRMHDTVSTAKVDGTIFLEDKNILAPGTDVIGLRQQVGMVFQNPSPFPTSIYRNVSYGLEIQGVRGRYGWLSKLINRHLRAADVETSTDPLHAAVCRSLKEAALWEEVKDRLHTSAMRLSGGQQQRLCIARAIAVRPQVLLLDEPCSALDPLSTRKIEELLLTLKTHYTIVIVTHNLHQARRIADDVAFFHAGELIEYGAADAIFTRPTHTLTREYVAGHFG